MSKSDYIVAKAESLSLAAQCKSNPFRPIRVGSAAPDLTLKLEETMQTFKRICLKDYTVTAENGDSFTVKRGKEYLTSAVNESSALGPEAIKGCVIVFADYWVPVPVSVFGGEIEFTKD